MNRPLSFNYQDYLKLQAQLQETAKERDKYKALYKEALKDMCLAAADSVCVICKTPKGECRQYPSGVCSFQYIGDDKDT